MTGKQKFINALEGRWSAGLVPHFELVFFLTMEAFGRVHPLQRNYGQWQQMSETERELHRQDMADLYVQTARKYGHAAIFYHAPGGWSDCYDEECMRGLEIIRQQTGEEYFLMMHGDMTIGLPDGNHMEELALRLVEEPEKIKQEQEEAVDRAMARAQRYRQHGALDGWALCSDYCFNTNPFLSPAQFDEFVTPYLARLTAGYREMGFYVIKHTDGNIMPILDSLVATRPHALHSLDPQGGVDIAVLKQKVGKEICLIGNVNCAMLDTGTDEQVVESTRYALKHGMPGGGYIFSTSNCIYTGMPLKRYDLMLDIWRKEGKYPG